MRFQIPHVFLGFTLLSQSAGAVDLTGTWSGKVACTGYDGAKFTLQMQNQVLKITQTEERLAMQWLDENLPFNDYMGVVIDDNKRSATKGQVAVAACTTNPNLTSDFSEIASLSVNILRDKHRGRLTGTSIYTSNLYGFDVTQCKWIFKLVDTTDPNIIASCEAAAN